LPVKAKLAGVVGAVKASGAWPEKKALDGLLFCASV
jgi:hypothetical protein